MIRHTGHVRRERDETRDFDSYFRGRAVCRRASGAQRYQQRCCEGSRMAPAGTVSRRLGNHGRRHPEPARCVLFRRSGRRHLAHRRCGPDVVCAVSARTRGFGGRACQRAFQSERDLCRHRPARAALRYCGRHGRLQIDGRRNELDVTGASGHTLHRRDLDQSH